MIGNSISPEVNERIRVRVSLALSGLLVTSVVLKSTSNSWHFFSSEAIYFLIVGSAMFTTWFVGLVLYDETIAEARYRRNLRPSVQTHRCIRCDRVMVMDRVYREHDLCSTCIAEATAFIEEHSRPPQVQFGHPESIVASGSGHLYQLTGGGDLSYSSVITNLQTNTAVTITSASPPEPTFILVNGPPLNRLQKVGSGNWVI